MDYLPTAIFKYLYDDNFNLADGVYPLMITNDYVVVGPGMILAEGVSPIMDFFPGYDNMQTFIRKMMAGERGEYGFRGTIGNITGHFNISYAPVTVRSFFPMDSTDIARGVHNEMTLQYSLALIETEKGLMEPFKSIDEFSEDTVDICIGVLSTLIALSTMLIVFIAFKVTRLMAEGILQLFDVMKNINT